MLKTIQLLLSVNTCPQVEPMSNFNTTEYIRSTWFIQQQQLTDIKTVTLFIVWHRL